MGTALVVSIVAPSAASQELEPPLSPIGRPAPADATFKQKLVVVATEEEHCHDHRKNVRSIKYDTF